MLGQGLSLAIGNRFFSFQTFEDVDVYFSFNLLALKWFKRLIF